MVKTVILRCSACGKTYKYNVGAGTQFATWHDVAVRITDKKEYEKLLETYMKISNQRSKAEMLAFSENPAEVLNNICYDLCADESRKLLAEEGEGTDEKYFGEKAKETVAESRAKWEAVMQSEGIIAFEGMYLCPKTQHIRPGIHLSMRWRDDKKDKTYTYVNKCDECNAAMTLLDDQNVGFMHEGCPTVGRCECGKTLVIDSVSFKLPQQEQQA